MAINNIGTNTNWNIFLPTVKLYSKQYEPDWDESMDEGFDGGVNPHPRKGRAIINVYDAQLTGSFLFIDGLESMSEASNFTFVVIANTLNNDGTTSNEQDGIDFENLHFKKNDAIEFTVLGEKRVHLIQTIERKVLSRQPLTFEYTVDTVDYTMSLGMQYTNLLFPRSSRYSMDGFKDYENLLAVVERVRYQQVIEPAGSRNVYTMFDAYTPELLVLLTNYTDVPELSFKGKTTLEAITQIFSLLDGQPILTFENQRSILGIQRFADVKDNIQLDLEALDSIEYSDDNKDYATIAYAEVDNITSDNTIKEYVNFISPEGGAYSDDSVVLRLKYPIKYIKSISFIDQNSGSLFEYVARMDFEGTGDGRFPAVVPKGLFDSIDNEDDRYSTAYYTIGDNLIEGFGTQRTVPTITGNTTVLVAKNIFADKCTPSYNQGDSVISQAIAVIEYIPLFTNQYTTVCRKDISEVNKTSYLQVNTNTREADEKLVSNYLQASIDSSGEKEVTKVLTFALDSNPQIPKILDYDEVEDRIVTGRMVEVNGNYVTATLTLAREFAHKPLNINTNVTERSYGIDYENATKRNIVYQEFLELDDKPTRVSDVNLPSIEQSGLDAFNSLFTGDSFPSIKSSYFSTDYTGDNTLVLPSPCSSGINYNSTRLTTLDPINVAEYYDPNPSAGAEFRGLYGIPYASQYGEMSSFAIQFGPDPERISVIQNTDDIKLLPRIENTNVKNDRINAASYISLGSKGASTQNAFEVTTVDNDKTVIADNEHLFKLKYNDGILNGEVERVSDFTTGDGDTVTFTTSEIYNNIDIINPDRRVFPEPGPGEPPVDTTPIYPTTEIYIDTPNQHNICVGLSDGKLTHNTALDLTFSFGMDIITVDDTEDFYVSNNPNNNRLSVDINVYVIEEISGVDTELHIGSITDLTCTRNDVVLSRNENDLVQAQFRWEYKQDLFKSISYTGEANTIINAPDQRIKGFKITIDNDIETIISNQYLNTTPIVSGIVNNFDYVIYRPTFTVDNLSTYSIEYLKDDEGNIVSRDVPIDKSSSEVMEFIYNLNIVSNNVDFYIGDGLSRLNGLFNDINNDITVESYLHESIVTKQKIIAKDIVDNSYKIDHNGFDGTIDAFNGSTNIFRQSNPSTGQQYSPTYFIKAVGDNPTLVDSSGNDKLFGSVVTVATVHDVVYNLDGDTRDEYYVLFGRNLINETTGEYGVLLNEITEKRIVFNHRSRRNGEFGTMNPYTFDKEYPDVYRVIYPLPPNQETGDLPDPLPEIPGKYVTMSYNESEDNIFYTKYNQAQAHIEETYVDVFPGINLDGYEHTDPSGNTYTLDQLRDVSFDYKFNANLTINEPSGASSNPNVTYNIMNTSGTADRDESRRLQYTLPSNTSFERRYNFDNDDVDRANPSFPIFYLRQDATEVDSTLPLPTEFFGNGRTSRTFGEFAAPSGNYSHVSGLLRIVNSGGNIGVISYLNNQYFNISTSNNIRVQLRHIQGTEMEGWYTLQARDESSGAWHDISNRIDPGDTTNGTTKSLNFDIIRNMRASAIRLHGNFNKPWGSGFDDEIYKFRTWINDGDTGNLDYTYDVNTSASLVTITETTGGTIAVIDNNNFLIGPSTKITRNTRSTSPFISQVRQATYIIDGTIDVDLKYIDPLYPDNDGSNVRYDVDPLPSRTITGAEEISGVLIPNMELLNGLANQAQPLDGYYIKTKITLAGVSREIEFSSGLVSERLNSGNMVINPDGSADFTDGSYTGDSVYNSFTINDIEVIIKLTDNSVSGSVDHVKNRVKNGRYNLAYYAKNNNRFPILGLEIEVLEAYYYVASNY